MGEEPLGARGDGRDRREGAAHRARRPAGIQARVVSGTDGIPPELLGRQAGSVGESRVSDEDVAAAFAKSAEEARALAAAQALTKRTPTRLRSRTARARSRGKATRARHRQGGRQTPRGRLAALHRHARRRRRAGKRLALAVGPLVQGNKDHPEVGGYKYRARARRAQRGFYADTICGLVEHLIAKFVMCAGRGPRRVHIMGYSHGGAARS